MRGKEALRNSRTRSLRITPAHAGKRPRAGFRAPRRWDHPRPCGEKLTVGVLYGAQVGSPPPMRGKEFEWQPNAEAARITPAHAGKRARKPCDADLSRDHPRPCGEKQRGIETASDHAGSPPPMRGKGTYVRITMIAHGITPAHAGKRREGHDLF